MGGLRQGRRSGANNINEYSQYEAEKSKILSMIKHLVKPLVPLSTKYTSVKLVVAMDNSFIQERVVHLLQNYGIGTVDTSQARKICPPKALVVQNGAMFNTLLYATDKSGTLVTR